MISLGRKTLPMEGWIIMKKRIAFDIGGTNIRAAIFDENIRLLDVMRCPMTDLLAPKEI